MTSKHLDIAVKAAKEAGTILKNRFDQEIVVTEKEKHDLVSEADYASEEYCLKILTSHFPTYTYVSEESGIKQSASDYTWYIDPLDGTFNYLSGNPYFSVSIALAFRGEVVLGVVYNPITEELFVAEKGKGSQCNGKPIRVRSVTGLQKALIVSTYAHSTDDQSMQESFQMLSRFVQSCLKVFINFSPALDLCNIARGKLDALIQRGTTPEDHAAGSLILREAGGTVQDYGGDEWHVDTVGIIATNGNLHQDIIQVVRRNNERQQGDNI